MKVIRLVLLLILIVCAGIGAAIVAMQRSFIYHPTHGELAVNYLGVTAEHIRTEDGETVVGWYLPPKTSNGVRGPIFLFFDGNAGRPDVWTHRYSDIEEGGGGFLYLAYRGFSGSTGTPTEAGLYADARAGYDWLIAQGYTGADIVIDGYSLGSGPATHLAMERPARALILEAPYSGVDDVAARFAGPFSALVLDRFNNRDFIRNVHMPVLILHGDRDGVVPFAQGQRLYALANEPKQFVRMPGSTHASLVGDGVYAHIWAFLAQHPGRS